MDGVYDLEADQRKRGELLLKKTVLSDN